MTSNDSILPNPLKGNCQQQSPYDRDYWLDSLIFNTISNTLSSNNTYKDQAFDKLKFLGLDLQMYGMK
jgi:hypothetical protein